MTIPMRTFDFSRGTKRGSFAMAMIARDERHA